MGWADGYGYTVNRSGNIGDSLTWVILKDGEQVLARFVGNELSFDFQSYTTAASLVQIYLEQFIGGYYQPVSNLVEVQIP
ncbi:MAG: hypothetical protein GY820_04345 [Gammaproteobacteria bacterium]|nr:hypothetical protein [Gammaproteobacteria bacterium]